MLVLRSFHWKCINWSSPCTCAHKVNKEKQSMHTFKHHNIQCRASVFCGKAFRCSEGRRDGIVLENGANARCPRRTYPLRASGLTVLVPDSRVSFPARNSTRCFLAGASLVKGSGAMYVALVSLVLSLVNKLPVKFWLDKTITGYSAIYNRNLVFFYGSDRNKNVWGRNARQRRFSGRCRFRRFRARRLYVNLTFGSLSTAYSLIPVHIIWTDDFACCARCCQSVRLRMLDWAPFPAVTCLYIIHPCQQRTVQQSNQTMKPMHSLTCK